MAEQARYGLPKQMSWGVMFISETNRINTRQVYNLLIIMHLFHDIFE